MTEDKRARADCRSAFRTLARACPRRRVSGVCRRSGNRRRCCGFFPTCYDTCFSRHRLLRGMLSKTTYFCAAHASRQKGGVKNANGRIRRSLPRKTDLDILNEDDVQEIAMPLDLAPGKYLARSSPIEALLGELGRQLEIRFAGTRAPRNGINPMLFVVWGR